MEKLKIRCPHCQKLYEVDDSLIQSAQPQFDCLKCQHRFAFEYPPTSLPVLTYLVGAPKTEEAQDLRGSASKNCPKCSAVNSAESKECYSCQVIFEKLDGLPSDPNLKAQPSLVRKWKELVSDFENMDRHNEFIQSCHDMDAHGFALLKYQELKSAQGGDPVCDQMIARLHVLSVVRKNPVQTGESTSLQDLQKMFLAWFKKYGEFLPLVIAVGMILMGMSNLGYRNLIGLGFAIASLSLGVRLLLRGKIY